MKNIINIIKNILFICLIILFILLAIYQPVFAFMLNIKEISKLSYDETLKNEFLIKKYINDSLLIINIASEYNLFFKKFSYVAANGPILNIEYQFDTMDLINLYEFINFINLNSKYENIKISYLNISINKKSNSYNKTNILYKLTMGLEYKLVQNSSDNFSVPIVIVLQFIKDCFKQFDVESLFFNENFKYLAINGYFSLKGTKKMLLNNIINFKENIDHFEINEKQYTTIPDQVLIPFLLKIYFKN